METTPGVADLANFVDAAKRLYASGDVETRKVSSVFVMISGEPNTASRRIGDLLTSAIRLAMKNVYTDFYPPSCNPENNARLRTSWLPPSHPLSNRGLRHQTTRNDRHRRAITLIVRIHSRRAKRAKRRT